MRQRAFTLVELLVVVGIIAMLVSILMPSLVRAKQLANRTMCLTNTSGIGRAAMLYANDNDGFIPRGDDLIWFHAFLPYIGSTEKVRDYRHIRIYRCPSYPDARQTVCYVNNAWTFIGTWNPDGTQIMKPTPLGDFDNPAGTIYMADNSYGNGRPIVIRPNPSNNLNDVWSYQHLPKAGSSRRVALDRHLDGVCCMYVDGHSGPVVSMEMTREMWRDRRD